MSASVHFMHTRIFVDVRVKRKLSKLVLSVHVQMTDKGSAAWTGYFECILCLVRERTAGSFKCHLLVHPEVQASGCIAAGSNNSNRFGKLCQGQAKKIWSKTSSGSEVEHHDLPGGLEGTRCRVNHYLCVCCSRLYRIPVNKTAHV